MDTILKASYGDRQQRELNHKKVDRAAAARLEAEFKARKAVQGPRELPTPPRGSPRGDVPFWDAKYHGVPFVGHEAVTRPQAKATQVEIRPGIFHTVDVVRPAPPPAGASPGQQAKAGAVARTGSADHAPPSQQRDQGPANAPAKPSGPSGRGKHPSQRLPCEMDTVQLAPGLAQLEERMRGALKVAARMHVPERAILLRAFGKALGKSDVAIGVRDTITVSQFAAAWASLGVQISPGMLDTVFNKYGHNASGRMPVMVFVEALMYGAPRQVMLEQGGWVQRGAYLPGKPALHTGKILYPECKKGVWPPSDWQPAEAERSARLPDIRLQLEFVYGYDGFLATSPNIFYTASGEVVYFAAAVGIVYDKPTHTQRLFLGHDDDILCLAIHPDRTTVATGQVGKNPCVIIWDTTTLQTLQTIHQGPGNRGVQAACFSSSGNKLAVVCTDNSHTLYIWDWPRKQLLLERKTAPGAPPTTYGVVWSPFEHDRLLTYGQNYVKFFVVQRPDGGAAAQQVGAAAQQVKAWECKQDAGVFNICKTYSVFSACFLPGGVVLTGNGAGAIGSWRGCRLVKNTPAHAPGPMEHRPDGTPSHGGVRCLVLQTTGWLLSGGADGYVIKWDVSSGDLGAALQRIPLLRPEQMGIVPPPAIRGLDCFPGSEVFVAGTASCDVWEVDDTPEVLVHGQQGELWGLAMNPAYPHVFATACDSDTVMVWSAATRKLAQKGDKARSCAFSPDGEHLAVGMYSGGLKVLEFHPSMAQIYWGQHFKESVDTMKYSPSGRYLAAGSHDQTLDVLDAKAGYKRVAHCVGHSSSITHLDWSEDSSTIQSNDQAYEILHFDPKTGKQVRENQRNTQWATWTCILGFDVMGIWPPDSDGTDINSCDRSPSGRYLLTADDRGRVSLFNYPVVVHQAPAQRYRGHSAHVMNVRWSADEAFAVSVGGRDRCILQWRVVKDNPAPDHFYGRQPLPALDKAGVVYRALDAAADAKSPPAPVPRPAAAPQGLSPAKVKPSNKPVLGGGGYGVR